MTLDQLIALKREAIAAKLKERAANVTTLAEIRGKEEVTEADEAKVAEVREANQKIDSEVRDLEVKIAEYEAERAADAAADALANVRIEGAPSPNERKPVATVVSEERTYAPHKERGFDQRTGKLELREGSKPGADFERDVAAAFFGDYEAQARLAKHMTEERVERAKYLGEERAAGTGAFAGLTVPQYLTDFYAPAVAAMRPFADACNKHTLPEAGMTVNLSRITTATSVALQSSENTAVSETNIDDTLLTLNVQTNAGQQTLSRQAIERGTGVEAVVMDDLFRRYHTNLDSTLLNQATSGLAAASTVIAYTSASPKVVEYYPIAVSALAAVEAAMLDQASGQNIAVMHSRRWYWLQNGLSSTWPLISQPGVVAQMLGENYNVAYGKGVRGILPNGTPVIVDNNVTTTGLAGATTGGTQDHTYVLDKTEAHLWEDPAAPVFIRAEQPAAASLGVLLVLYGYFAYTFQRYAESQLISGTGTVTPAFTGV
jgi:hypothetical protein